MSMGDEYRAFNNLLHALDISRYVGIERQGHRISILSTKADIIDADIKTLRSPYMIQGLIARFKDRIEDDSSHLSPAMQLDFLGRVRNVWMNSVREAWPHLRRSTRMGLRPFLVAHFRKIRELEQKLIWEGIENL